MDKRYKTKYATGAQCLTRMGSINALALGQDAIQILDPDFWLEARQNFGGGYTLLLCLRSRRYGRAGAMGVSKEHHIHGSWEAMEAEANTFAHYDPRGWSCLSKSVNFLGGTPISIDI